MKLHPFRLERYWAKHEFSVPYLLCSSDCESMTIGELLALEPDAQERFASSWLGFTVFSDEVYRGLELDPSDRLPAMADLNERAVSLGVMSKTYGLAGLRIGWVATRDEELLNRLAAFKDYTTICNSAPGEFLATLALRHADTIAERNLEIIRGNLDQLDQFFESHTPMFAWKRPKAGSIAFPRLLQDSVDVLCADLVERAGVLLLPGTLYGPDYNAFRIGFGRKNLPQALDRFDAYINKYCG